MALEQQLPKGIAVDFDALFPSLTGWGVEKKNRKRLELLTKVAPVLAGVLEGNETVQFVTRGSVNLWWEMLCMGIWAQVINGTTLVCTNLRLLLIHTYRDMPKSYVNQVPRDSVKKVSGGLGSITVKLGSGSIVLAGVPGADKKILTQQFPANTRARGGKELLCPKCYTVYRAHTTECTHCRATFKSPAVAARRSALLPGLGDFYLGHHLLACMELCGSLTVWLVVLLLVVDSFESGDTALALGIALGMIVVTHGVDAALTHAQGKKGLMALDDKLATRRKTTAAPVRQPSVPVPITPR
jgi:hypothetical protein